MKALKRMFKRSNTETKKQEEATECLAAIGAMYIQATEKDRNLRRSSERNGLHFRVMRVAANYGQVVK